MSGNLNINKLNLYTDRFVTKVLDETYKSREAIGGSDLLKITPVRQVNLGILNRLFEQWKNNALAFRSVYFDFGNQDVKHALEMFMNIASQHISVKRVDLEPLLRQSVSDAISLLYKSDPSKEDLEGMDLFLVSEIKRPKDGSMEIKFFDRLKALEKLGAGGEHETGAKQLFDAISNSARAVNDKENGN